MVTDVTKESLLSAGVDYDDGLSRFLGNADLYEKFILQFPQDATFSSLRTAVEQGAVLDAFHAAHTLKGVVGNLSFKALWDVLLPLVETLRAGDLAGAKILYPPVEAEYNRLCRTILE